MSRHPNQTHPSGYLGVSDRQHWFRDRDLSDDKDPATDPAAGLSLAQLHLGPTQPAPSPHIPAGPVSHPTHGFSRESTREGYSRQNTAPSRTPSSSLYSESITGLSRGNTGRLTRGLTALLAAGDYFEAYGSDEEGDDEAKGAFAHHAQANAVCASTATPQPLTVSSCPAALPGTESCSSRQALRDEAQTRAFAGGSQLASGIPDKCSEGEEDLADGVDELEQGSKGSGKRSLIHSSVGNLSNMSWEPESGASWASLSDCERLAMVVRMLLESKLGGWQAVKQTLERDYSAADMQYWSSMYDAACSYILSWHVPEAPAMQEVFAEAVKQMIAPGSSLQLTETQQTALLVRQMVEKLVFSCENVPVRIQELSLDAECKRDVVWIYLKACDYFNTAAVDTAASQEEFNDYVLYLDELSKHTSN